MKKDIFIGSSKKITLDSLVSVARFGGKVDITPADIKKIEKSHLFFKSIFDQKVPIYGLNTQFGNQAYVLDEHLLSDDDEYRKSVYERQVNLIRAHDCGLGIEAPEEIVRATMLLRANCLSLAHSGVRPLVIKNLIQLLNKKVHPVINRYGSIGASGDLVPLSSVAAALTLQDSADVNYSGKRMKAVDALADISLKKLEPEMREGIALINGTSYMTSIAALSLHDLQKLYPQMLSAIAMVMEALLVIDSAYNPLVHELKNHKGEIDVNDFFIKFWKGSSLVRGLKKINDDNITKIKQKGEFSNFLNLQDFYSLRSVPQGFGPMDENLKKAVQWIEEEMNSVNDNPIVSEKTNQVLHGANFMGYYVTEACDILKMDISQASSWMHSLYSNLLNSRKSSGLTENLVVHENTHHGFKPTQILFASLVVQNRKLAQSQQAFMVPTEGDNQDVNSLAVHAAYDFREAVQNLERMTAILFIAGAQALEMRGIKKASKKAQKIHAVLRTEVSFMEKDRSLRPDIESVITMMRESKLQ